MRRGTNFESLYFRKHSGLATAEERAMLEKCEGKESDYSSHSTLSNSL